MLMTIGQPLNSISLLVLNAAILYISFRFSFLVVFFMGSLMAAASFWNFHRGFTKIQTRYGQKLNEEAENAIEMEKMEELEAPKN